MEKVYYTVSYLTDKGKTEHTFIDEETAKTCLHRLISKFIDNRVNKTLTFTETYQGRVMESYSIEVYK